MIETVLTRKNASLKTRITVKSLISAAVVALAIILPQAVHAVYGQAGGVKFLPMYLPVLIGGCILGMKWGLLTGILSPLLSFVITSAFASPMPALQRLPFMMAELAVFAAVSGAFSEKIAKDGRYAFSAVLLAAVAGRAVFMLLVVVFQTLTPFTPAMIWSQIQTGLPALVMQAVTVPFIVMGLRLALLGDKKQ